MHIDTNKITSGAVIQYVLKLSERPTHPEKLWRGKIIAVFVRQKCVKVESMETDYEGCREFVQFCQIRAIDGEPPTSPLRRAAEKFSPPSGDYSHLWQEPPYHR